MKIYLITFEKWEDSKLIIKFPRPNCTSTVVLVLEVEGQGRV